MRATVVVGPRARLTLLRTLTQSIADDYLAWLKGHIGDLLALPNIFTTAAVYRVAPTHLFPSDNPERVHFVARNTLDSQQKLEEYFTTHAANMRKDALVRFEGKFSIQRRVHLLELAQP